MNFLQLTRQSVFQFVVMALVAFGFFAVLPLQAAQAQQTITVPCSGEIETPEGGLRATSDGNTWEFAIVPGEHTQIYDQQWLFNGLSPNSPNVEQGWGQFGGGGDGANAFSWVSPTQGGSYSIKVKAKRRCTLPGGEGGGDGPAADPNFEIEWDVDVQASKAWSTGAAMTATMAAPAANASVAPGVPVTVSVAASDSDHWIKGVEAGDEADDLIYSWSASGGFISGSGSSVSWTPPNATGVYTITCEVNDAPTEIGSVDTGTRDDEPKITVMVTLAVPPRTWSAGAGIGSVLDDKGQPVLKDGVALQNGRLVSPSNQTVPKPVGQENYPTIKVRPGRELRCTVESASDWDHWMRAGVGAETVTNHGTVHDDEEDEVKYTWSAGVGSFKDGKNTGTSVTWIAPKVGDAGFNPANEYTVTCAIDDTPKVVTAPDVPFGNTARDDASIERNFKVKVVDDTSWMELGLYKDQSANPQPASATIGGEVHIAVDVQIGGDTKITAPGAIYLRLTEHDGMNLHNVTDNHAYVLVSQTGWNEWNFAGNSWGTDPISMPNSNTTNTPRRFRKWIAWNTTAPIDNGIDPDGDGVLLQAGKLWGHNASHTVELEYVADNAIKHEMEFRPNDEVDPARKSGPNLIGAEVGNLVITNVTTNAGNPNYFFFYNESTNATLSNPTVTFKISNNGDTTVKANRYHWWLWVRETTVNGPSNFVTYEGYANSPGVVAMQINKDGLKYKKKEGEDLTEWGTYAFDIHVQDDETGDWQGVRSNPGQLSIPQQMADAQGNPFLQSNGQPILEEDGTLRQGHEITYKEDENGSVQWLASYFLKSERDASSMQVDLINPNFTKLAKVSGPIAKNLPKLDLPLYVQNNSDDNGEYIGVFIPSDNFPEQNRSHAFKPMLAINDRSIKPLRMRFKSNAMVNDGSNVKTISYIKVRKRVAYTATRGRIAIWDDSKINLSTDGGGSKGSDAAGQDRRWTITSRDIDPESVLNPAHDTGWFFNSYTYEATKKDEPDKVVWPTIYVVNLSVPNTPTLQAEVYVEYKPTGPAEGQQIALAKAIKAAGADIVDIILLKATGAIHEAAIAATDDIRNAGKIPHPNVGGPGGSSGNSRDNRDAVAHTIWSAILTYNFGSKVAKIVTDAHEIKDLSKVVANDHIMDLLNNRQGRALAGFAEGDYTDQQLANAVVDALNNGNLFRLDEVTNPRQRGLLVFTPYGK